MSVPGPCFALAGLGMENEVWPHMALFRPTMKKDRLLTKNSDVARYSMVG